MREKNPLSITEFAIPNDFKLEVTTLCEMITGANLLSEVWDCTCLDMFYDKRCRDTYRAIKEMYENREKIDFMTISTRIDKAFFTHELITNSAYVINAFELRAHCSALVELMQKRKFYFFCAEGLRMSVQPTTTEGELFEQSEQLKKSLQEGSLTDSTELLDDVVEKVADNIQNNDFKRIATGFPSLDRLTYGGLAAGNLVILAARPSVGKTAFMLQMASTSAEKQIPTLVLSLEMTNVDLAKRLLCSTEYVNPYQMASGEMDWQNFERAKAVLAKKTLYMDEKPSTIEDVCALITKNHHRGQCEIAFVDYLQLMSSTERAESQNIQVGEMTKRLKKLAKALKIPIVLLCQLNRKVASENRAPQLYDLRDSGSIEQDADIVLMLERKQDAEGNNTKEVNMYLRKNREGIKDVTIRCESNDNYTKFYEI